MAVWLTKDEKVILIGDKVYTGSTNPCGYAYLQKCTYKEGTATSSPTNTAELIAVRVAKFCNYTSATEWFNQNSGTYPTSGTTSYTLLNSQLSGTESAAGWLTCADESNITLGTCSYNPKIYYVHSRCDCTAGKETGTTKATITTSSVNASYDTHEGPFVYTEAKTKYNTLNNKSCTCADYLYVVVGSSCNCSAERWNTTVAFYKKGSSYTGTGTILAGPFETETEAFTANGQIYPCTCQWYFAWDCQSLCGTQDGGTLTYRVYGPSSTPYSASSYDGVLGPYPSRDAAEAAMAEYEKKTCTCPDLKWYLYVTCSNGQYETFIKNDADGYSDFELEGVYETKDEANAAAAKYTGSCAEKYCVYLCCSPSTCKMELKSAKVSATYSGTVTDYVNKLNEGDSKWNPYSTYSSYTDWVSEDVAANLVSQWRSDCCQPDHKREDGGGYNWYYAYCVDGGVVTAGFYNHLPKCTAAEWIAMQNISGKCFAEQSGYEHTPMSAVSVTVTSGESKRGFYRSDATVKFGSCASTASLLLSDTPDDLQ